MGKTN